jgi:hypothetical protein
MFLLTVLLTRLQYVEQHQLMYHFQKTREGQAMNTIAAVNRCRPGSGASCAFCCGSHNYTVSPERIEDMFINRGRECYKRPTKHPEDASEGKLVRDGMQCPHVGITAEDPGLVCCLAYFDCDLSGKLQSFFTGTCKNFLCEAWDELTDRQVLFAAGLMGDWYYYSLLINDTGSLRTICTDYSSPEDVPAETLRMLKAELAERLLGEDVI